MIASLFLLALVATAPVPAPPGTSVPPQSQYVRSIYGTCPDGVVVEIALYDTDSNDPDAMALVYKRGEHVVAILDNKTKIIYVVGAKRSMPLSEAQQLYPNPCALPDGTGV